MAKEYFWGAKLTKDERTFTWDPEEEFKDDEDDEDDDAITHFLFLKQAVLGGEAKEGERNIVEIKTTDFAGESITHPLFSLKMGLNESVCLDIGLQPPVTFKLTQGSGPVCLSGQHAIDLQEDEDFGKDFQDDDILDLEEEEEEGEGASPDFKQLVKIKEQKKPAAAGKATAKGAKVTKKEEEEDEDDEEDEEEEEEEEKLSGKGKKRPAPSSTGAAKKFSKLAQAEEDDDDDDDEEDDLDWKMALGDDDEEDEEDSDEDEEDMEDEDDEEDEDEEEEEEESSPDKPVKKPKGKVNGTVKKAEPQKTAESQKAQTKSKGKDKKKTFSIEEMKQDLIKSPSKPKKEDKFTNFVKSRFHITDSKKIQELWTWYKSSQLK